MEFQPKLGELVGIPMGPKGLVQQGSATIIQGRVVAIDHDDGGLDVCVGLMGTTGLPADAVHFDKFDSSVWMNANTTNDIRNYDKLLWIYHDDLEVVYDQRQPSQLQTPIAKQGVSCSKCGEGNPWGEPNQPDGTYKCRGCKRS